MPKITDIKAYYRDIATKAGLSDDEVKQVVAALDNDKFAKAFTDGFMPLPNYSHDLDDVRTKTKADKDKEYADWFAKEQQKYGEFVAGIDKLKKYEEIYGALDVANPPNPNDNRGGPKAMTTEEIDKLVETKLQTILGHRDTTVVELMDVREFHLDKFKKSLDVKAFEAAWKEHPEWGGSLKTAYEKYVDPEMKKMSEAAADARAEARYQEGLRDGFSRRSLPTDTANKEFSPLFDRKADIDKMSGSEQESHSRNAFFDGLREGNKQPA